MNYYYLIAGLPIIEIEDNKLTYSIADFKNEVRPQLSMFDRRLFDLFFMKFDNQNLLRYLKDRETNFDERGNITKDEMEKYFRLIDKSNEPSKYLSYLKPVNKHVLTPTKEYLSDLREYFRLIEVNESGNYKSYLKPENKYVITPVNQLNLADEYLSYLKPASKYFQSHVKPKSKFFLSHFRPKSKYFLSYFKTFVSEYKDAQQRGDEMVDAQWENRLAELYYRWAMKCNNKLLSAWFEFNLNLNNILAATIGRKYKMDVEVIGDNKVAESIKTSKQRDFGLSTIIEDMDIFQRLADETDLYEREKKIDLLKWKWLEDKTFFKYFCIEILFAYLVKLEIIERWISLDPVEGEKIFRNLINNLKDGVVNSPESINLQKSLL